jgi:hypothetical protein
MKNILVLGWSRSGKTTLTRRLKEEFKYNTVSSCVFLDALGRAYPQLLGGEKNQQGVAPSTLASFIAHHICSLVRYSKHWSEAKFVADVELGIYDFDKVFPLIDKLLFETGGLVTKDELMYIGLVNRGTSEEVYCGIKKHDTMKDWTYSHPDDETKAMCNDYPALTQAYSELFVEYGFLVYDTSGDREKVFKKIIDDVRQINNQE